MSTQAHKTSSDKRPLRRDWTLFLSFGTLIIAIGLAIIKLFGEGPANLQTGHISTIYWAVLAYAYLALPITGVTIFVEILLGLVWMRRLSQKAHHVTALVALGVTSLACLSASISTLPQLFVGYHHLASTKYGAYQYHLGVRTALDGDYFFVVSQCDRWNVECQTRAVTSVDQAERADLQHVRLESDTTTNTIYIRTTTQTIPFVINQP